MNRTPQYESHPDTDQLTAFVEHTLTDIEQRQTLAHIAGCARCREIIYLSQEAAAEDAGSAAQNLKPSGQLGWLKGWRFVWIAGPALALALFLTVSLLRWHDHGAAEPVTTARLSPETQIKAVVASPPPVPASAVDNQIAKQSTQSPAKLPAIPTKDMRAQAAPTTEMIEKRTPVSAMGGMHGMGMAGGMGYGQGAGVSAYASRGTFQNAAPVNAGTASSAAALPSAPAPVSQITGVIIPPQQAAVGEAKSSPVISQQNETVEVAAASAITDAQIVNARVTAKQLRATRWMAGGFKLPNGQLAVSTATALPRILAIDAAGNLFLSADAGAHWQSVPSQWTGHAIKLRLQGEPTHNAPVTDAATPDSVQKASAALTAAPSTPVFELVTNEGKLWSSTDGMTWAFR
jgi:hypothetical protein